MRMIAAILSLLMATAAWAAGPEDGPDGEILAQAAKSVVQVVSTGCAGEDDVERSGSGFVLAKNGLIVTDLHVVAGCTSYQVRYQNAGEASAIVVHVLKARDLALLKVDQPPPGVQIPGLQAAAATPQVNERLDVIGYPLGLGTYDSAPLNVGLATRTTPELHYALDPPSLDELTAAGSPAPDTQVVRVNGSLLPGDSGAPLIDYQGNVAGIGDGGLQRGTVGIGWATQTQYLDQLVNSTESPTAASGTIASVDFAVTIPKTKADMADSTVKCGALSLVRSRDLRVGALIKSTDDPVKLRKLAQDLIGAPIDQFDNDKFSIWIEPNSGAGIALPKELHIETGPDHCTVHTAAPNIDYIIALAQLPFDAASPEWELEANRQKWLELHRAAVVAETHRLAGDREHTVPRRFENGGIIIRGMATGQSTAGKSVRVFTNDLSGRGAFVSVSLVNRDAKADPNAMTEAERVAWARGLLAVNLTALPPVQEAARTPQSSVAGASEASDMVWPGPRSYPRVHCGDAALIPLSQPRTLAELAGFADLDAVLRPLTGAPSAQIAQDRFDAWVQPRKGAVVLLPHGLAPTSNPQVCRIPSAAAAISFALRVVVSRGMNLPIAERRHDAQAAVQDFFDDLAQAAGVPLRRDPAAHFQTRIDPSGLVRGRLSIGTRPDGGRALIYLVSLTRAPVLTLFAMTDYDAKSAAALAPADRAALAQALAAVRLSTLLPPTGFLTSPQVTNPASPAAVQTANH
jgi:S1-C subfamily serine protease